MPRLALDRTYTTPTPMGRSNDELDADLFSQAPCRGDHRFSDVDTTSMATQLVAFGCLRCPAQVAVRCGEIGVEIGATVGVWGGSLRAYRRPARDLRGRAMELLADPAWVRRATSV